MKTKRPYKTAAPAATVKRIKQILNDAEIVPKELELYNPYPGIYSVRIELDKQKGQFGTNGKGRDVAYTLASGYAEFVERIQNGLYLYSISKTNICSLKKSTGYYFFPDEKEISFSKFNQLPKQIRNDFFDDQAYSSEYQEEYFKHATSGDSKGIISVPFFDTKNSKEIYIPYNLLLLTVGSNGMAAGNSKDEAIYQALCEIMERYAGSEVFYKQLTPPTVPRDHVQKFSESYKIIKEIEKDGVYEVVVKDFSAGLKLPVLGLILINRESQKYSLNIGTDSDFETALNRCLTEIFQGIKCDSALNESMHPIPIKELSFFKTTNEKNHKKRQDEYANFTKDGSGQFPKALFGPTPSYDFDQALFSPKLSYKKENESVITKFISLGMNVYIRDSSFLGFPTVFVYVPGASLTGNKSVCDLDRESWKTYINVSNDLGDFFKLKSLDKTQLLKLADTFSGIEEIDYNEKIEQIANIELDDKSTTKHVPISYLMSLVWIKLGYYVKAEESLRRFYESNPHDYYRIILKYLTLRGIALPHESVIKLLEKNGTLNREYIDLIDRELHPDSDIFSNLKLPSCPNCHECELVSSCHTKNKLETSQNIYKQMNMNTINQREVVNYILE